MTETLYGGVSGGMSIYKRADPGAGVMNGYIVDNSGVPVPGAVWVLRDAAGNEINTAQNLNNINDFFKANVAIIGNPITGQPVTIIAPDIGAKIYEASKADPVATIEALKQIAIAATPTATSGVTTPATSGVTTPATSGVSPQAAVIAPPVVSELLSAIAATPTTTTDKNVNITINQPPGTTQRATTAGSALSTKTMAILGAVAGVFLIIIVLVVRGRK